VAALTLLSAVTTLDARAAFWDNTNVSFRNSYGKTVSVAILRDSEICGGWAKKGWYELAPGEVKKVFSTTARYAYYYAEAVDGHTWSGNEGPWTVYDRAFDDCLYAGTDPKGYQVRMRRIDTKGTSNYEVNLIP
jgi:uncharacterized membrane protein